MKSFLEELNLYKEPTGRLYLYWKFDKGFLNLQLLLKQEVS